MAKSKKKSFSSPLDQIEDSTPPTNPATRSSRRRGRNFDTPTDQVQQNEVRAVSPKQQPQTGKKDKRVAGKYYREAIALPPEQVELIKQLAAENDMSKLAFYRWLIDQALLDYEDGHRPNLDQFIRTTEAAKGHWSSSESK